jgi:hypothetical protein
MHILQDLETHESAKGSKAKALANMTLFRGRYDPRMLEAAAAVFNVYLECARPMESPPRAVGIKELRVGWTLAAEARTRDGMLIVPLGTQISPILMEKLRNFAELGELEEPLLVTRAADIK